MGTPEVFNQADPSDPRGHDLPEGTYEMRDGQLKPADSPLVGSDFMGDIEMDVPGTLIDARERFAEKRRFDGSMDLEDELADLEAQVAALPEEERKGLLDRALSTKKGQIAALVGIIGVLGFAGATDRKAARMEVENNPANHTTDSTKKADGFNVNGKRVNVSDLER